MGKRVVFEGGRVTFSIPNGWVEEYDDEDGGGVFYEDRPGSGTLRLDVATFAVPEVAETAAGEMIATVAEIAPEAVETLPSGAAFAHTQELDREDGRPVVLHLWYLSSPLPPEHLRLAVFSYTLPKESASGPRTKAELRWLDAAVREARFAERLLEGEPVDEGDDELQD